MYDSEPLLFSRTRSRFHRPFMCDFVLFWQNSTSEFAMKKIKVIKGEPFSLTQEESRLLDQLWKKQENGNQGYLWTDKPQNEEHNEI
jgi:hypothetical protein